MNREERRNLLQSRYKAYKRLPKKHKKAMNISLQMLQNRRTQPKMGRWIEHFDESGKWYECDQCHTDWGGPVNYCPNCGAKM